MRRQNIGLDFVVLLCAFGLVSSISFEEDVTLTAKEKDALDKFKSLVIPKIPKSSYIQNYVKDDLYFIHWIRAKRINIRAAEEMFLNHLKWRETENIDKINEDDFDWVQFDKEYPLFFNNTVDKKGSPTGEFWFGEWNVRQMVISGMGRKLPRSMARLHENLTRRLFKARAEGKQISQAQIIIDLDGFNLLQGACPSCMPGNLAATNLFENHYPYLYDNVFFINMSPAFGTLLNILRPLMSESTSRAFKIYSDRNQWLKALDEKIDRSQRSLRLGGTIVRDRE